MHRRSFCDELCKLYDVIYVVYITSYSWQSSSLNERLRFIGINQCHRVRLGVAVLVNSVFTNVRANMAAEALWINMDILFISVLNYPHFILRQNQEVVQEPAHTATQKKKNTFKGLIPIGVNCKVLQVLLGFLLPFKWVVGYSSDPVQKIKCRKAHI